MFCWSGIGSPGAGVAPVVRTLGRDGDTGNDDRRNFARSPMFSAGCAPCEGNYYSDKQ